MDHHRPLAVSDLDLPAPSADPPPVHTSGTLSEVFPFDLDAHSASAVDLGGKSLGLLFMERDISGDPPEGDQGVGVHVIAPPASGDGSPPPATLDASGSLPPSSVALPFAGDMSADATAEMDRDLSADGSILVSDIAAKAPRVRSVEVKKKQESEKLLLHSVSSPIIPALAPAVVIGGGCHVTFPGFGLSFVRANI